MVPRNLAKTDAFGLYFSEKRLKIRDKKVYWRVNSRLSRRHDVRCRSAWTLSDRHQPLDVGKTSTWIIRNFALSRFETRCCCCCCIRRLALRLWSVTLSPTYNVRVLDVLFSSDLNLDKHVANVAGSCFCWLRRSLDIDSLKTLVHEWTTETQSLSGHLST